MQPKPNLHKPILVFFVLLTTIRLSAQCPGVKVTVKLTGGPCLGSPLVFTSNSKPVSVSWYNGSTLVTSEAAKPSGKIITVAGGKGPGTAANQLNNPDRIFVTPGGVTYIADYSNHRVQKWTPGTATGITVAGGNGAGSSSTQLSYPAAVFVDNQENVYVADKDNSRVQKWARGATSGVTVAGDYSSGYLPSPTDLFIDKTGNLYISAQGGNAVYMYPAGGGARQVVAGTESWGSGPTQLDTPTGIFVDGEGNLYVCDTENRRVMKWPRGAREGIEIAGSGALSNPVDVAVDCNGNVYVSDNGNHRVQMFAPGNTTGITVAGGNGAGDGNNQLRNPYGVFPDSLGNIYVADFGNHRVQMIVNGAENINTPVTAGKYTVKAVFDGGTVVTDTIELASPEAPSITIKSDTSMLCPGTGTVIYRATVENGGALPVYRWYKNGISTGAGKAVFTDNTAMPGDEVYCECVTSNPCTSAPVAASNKIQITTLPPVYPSLGSDTTICPATNITLKLSSRYKKYLWNNLSTQSTLRVTEPGKYYVDVADFCSRVFTDTLEVKLFALTTGFLPADTLICSYDKILLASSVPFNSYRWSNNTSSEQLEAGTGTHWLQATDKNGCINRDTIVITGKNCPPKGFYIPTAFTPDRDGKNDTFKPTFYGVATSYRFTVYNRYGQQLFTSSRLNYGWDGLANGKYVDTGAYIWTCQYQLDNGPLQIQKGTITLIR